MSKTLLISGGAGFIGSNYIIKQLQQSETVNIINIDKLSYAGNLDNLSDIHSHERYRFIEADICDRSVLEELFQQQPIDGVIHFAAESHVDNSIKGPEEFFRTNVMGTFQLLDVARCHWMQAPHQVKAEYQHCRFHHISTDEVYGSLGDSGFFTETTPYAPNSPYSASKAGSDFIVRSYFHTFGMNVVTTNCSNNFGPRQHDEKLIPTIIRNALAKAPIPLYGDGKNIRDWLYVDDHIHGIDVVFARGNAGETYNLGGNNELTNLAIAEALCDVLDRLHPSTHSYREQIQFVNDRPGHDRRYAIDCNKIQTELNWQANTRFIDALEHTVKWYLKKYT